jgi:DNA repair protein RadC
MHELLAAIMDADIPPEAWASGWPDSLTALANLPHAALAHVLHVSDEAAARLAAALELHRRLMHEAAPVRPCIMSPEDVLPILAPLRLYDHERMWCLPLDVRSRLIGEPLEVSRGDVNGTDAGARLVFRAALRVGATTVMIAHNHPSGDVVPSAADIAVTRKLAAAGRTVDIALVDHLIVATGGAWASLRRDMPSCFH